MQFKTLFPILVFFSQSLTRTALAQAETKPVQVRTFEGEVEEYSVLATDKKVRQGPYVRYRAASIAGLIVLEAGNYDHGEKEGEWSQFAKERPWNSLLSKGTFHNGLPDGLWTYYHYKYLSGGPFNRAGTPTAQATANGPGPKAGYSVNIADTAAIVQAQGLCARGVRVGIWVYYDRKGQVTQKIDGKLVAAEYKVRITTTAKKVGERTQLMTTVDALGD